MMRDMDSGGGYYDTAHGPDVWDTFNDCLVGTGGRSGGPSIDGTLTAYSRVRACKAVNPTPSNELTYGFYLNQGSMGAVGTYVYGSIHGVGPFSLSTQQVTLISDNAGHVSVTRGSYSGPVVAGPTSASVITASATQYVELYAKIHPTAGAVTVRVNNIVVLIATGINTQGLGSTVIGGYELVPGVGRYSDIYANDPSGTRNTGFEGSGFHVLTLFPRAVGDLSEMTPVSGSNYTNVDDNPADDGTTNVNAPSLYLRDSYPLTTIASTYDVLATKPIARSRKSSSVDARNLLIGARIDGADYELTTHGLTAVTYRYYNFISEEYPVDGTVWTVAKINNSQALIQRVL